MQLCQPPVPLPPFAPSPFVPLPDAVSGATLGLTPLTHLPPVTIQDHVKSNIVDHHHPGISDQFFLPPTCLLQQE